MNDKLKCINGILEQEKYYFLNEGQQECYSFYERAGRAQRLSETLQYGQEVKHSHIASRVIKI